ncbi:MAG: hypothetical protein J6A01_05995 [Proteobacteria bacterium]|nr:hypothetical protein [Pseudomonadota bacterium]
MMNPYFSFGRFFQLLRLNLSTHILSLALTFIIYFGIVFCINMLIQNSLANAIAGGDINDVVIPLIIFVIFFAIFMIATPILASVLVSKCANQYHKRESATQLLLLPASKIEQFSVLYLLYVILVPILFYLGTCFLEYYYIDHAMTSIASLLIAGKSYTDTNTFSELATNFFDIVTNPKLYLILISSQSIFFLGAILFKSFNFIKTVFCMFGLLIGILITQAYLPDLAFFSTNMDALTHTTISEYSVSIIITLVCSALAWIKFRRYVLV